MQYGNATLVKIKEDETGRISEDKWKGESADGSSDMDVSAVPGEEDAC